MINKMFVFPGTCRKAGLSQQTGIYRHVKVGGTCAQELKGMIISAVMQIRLLRGTDAGITCTQAQPGKVTCPKASNFICPPHRCLSLSCTLRSAQVEQS